MQASAGEAAVRVVLILQNLVLLLFMGGLAWIFRMRGGKAVEATAFLDLVPYDDVLRRIPAD